MSNLTWNELKPIDCETKNYKKIHFPNDEKYLDFYEKFDEYKLGQNLLLDDEFWLQPAKNLVVDICNPNEYKNHINEAKVLVSKFKIIENKKLQTDVYKIIYNDKEYDDVKVTNIELLMKDEFYAKCTNYIKTHGKTTIVSDYHKRDKLSRGYHFSKRLLSNGLLYGDGCFNFQKYWLHAKYSYEYDADMMLFQEYFTIEEANDKLRSGPSVLEMQQILATYVNLD